MRSLASFLSLTLFAIPAAAIAAPSDAPIRTVSAASVPAPVPAPAPAPQVLTAIDHEDVPPRCQDLAKRAALPSQPQALSARISLASCLADAKLATLELCDCNESVLAADAAVAPSLELLDQVIATGDASTRVLAQHAKAELYTSMVMKLRATVPAAAGTTPEAYALRDSRMAIVETMIVPWREQARAAHQQVVDLAKGTAALAKNPVVQNLVRDSKARLAEAPPPARTPVPQTAAADLEPPSE